MTAGTKQGRGTRFKRGLGLGLTVGLLGLLIGAYCSDELLLTNPARKAARYREKIGERLAAQHGLGLLLTFDEPVVRDWISGALATYPGTEQIPGPTGGARQFDGSPSAAIETSTPWSDLGANFTLSVWLRLAAGADDQDLVHTSSHGRRVGLGLRDGRLCFFVPAPGLEQSVSYAYTAYDRFAHVVAVADLAAGEARLYEDGVLKAAAPITRVDHPPHNIELGKLRWYAVTRPIQGAVGELAAWRRALGAAEIQRLTTARQQLAATLEPRYYRRWRLMQAGAAGARRLLSLANALPSWRGVTRRRLAALPEVHLVLSAADERHVARAHAAALTAGRRTTAGAQLRRIHHIESGRGGEAHLQLDGSDRAYPSSPRPAYRLEFPDRANALALRSARLSPPENETALEGLVTAAAARRLGRPHRRNGLCRLTINHEFQGIYYYEDHRTAGLEPGQALEYARAPDNTGAWQSLFSPPRHDPLTHYPPAIISAALREVAAEWVPLLGRGAHSPVSRREWRRRLRSRAADLPDEPAPQAAAQLNALSRFDLLGKNPSPDYVLTDLELPRRLADLDLVWESSHPEWLSAAGVYQAPASQTFIEVTLTVRAADPAAPAAPRQFVFRLRPHNPPWAALMLTVAEPVRKMRRTDFTALYYPAGGAPARRLTGRQHSDGGIKHRGNTSFWRGNLQPPFSLRCDAPHYLLDDTPTLHLYLLNGYLDHTRLKNKLSYDLFRAFGTPATPRHAPQADFAEVFFNGTYLGMYEMGTRIHAEMLGYPRRSPAHSPALLYKMRGPGNLFQEHLPSLPYDQKLPSPRRQPMPDPFHDLVAFTSAAPPETFAAYAHHWLDLDYLVDFLLLVNLAENVDGRTTNFYIARPPKPEAPFFFIPWDYDRTFGNRQEWFSNHLFGRLETEHPRFPQMLRARWAELRAGPLAFAAIDRRLTAMADRIGPAIAFEEVRLPRRGELPPYPERLAALRAAITGRLAYLDHRLAPQPAGDHHDPSQDPDPLP